jgi:hypothetical protein
LKVTFGVIHALRITQIWLQSYHACAGSPWWADPDRQTKIS